MIETIPPDSAARGYSGTASCIVQGREADLVVEAEFCCLKSEKIPFVSLDELHLAGSENSDYEVLISSLATHHSITLEEAEGRVRQDHERGPYVNQAVTAFIKCLIEGAEIQVLYDKHPKWGR